MDTTERILLIFLSSALALSLLLSIIFLVIIIKIALHIRRITARAEAIADKADTVASFFEKTAWPVAIAKLVANMGSHFGNEHKKRKKGTHGTQSE